MPEYEKLFISSEADRLTVAAILVKNGYKVSQGKMKNPGKKNYLHFLEYSKQTQDVEE